MSAVSIDVVLPTYEKADTLELLITHLEALFADLSAYNFRAIFVLDGPDPKAQKILEACRDPRFITIVTPYHSGKGSATRAAIPMIEGDVVVTMDADLDINPLSVLSGVKLMNVIDSRLIGCAYGSKVHPDSIVNYPFVRRVASYLFRSVVKLLFRVDIDDSQTGLKVFPANVFVNLGKRCTEDRFLFDLELMTLISRNGYTLQSFPVHLSYQYDSTIRFQTVFKMIIDTVRLARKLRVNPTTESLV